MLPKLEERNKAFALRKKGHSYSEILREVPVAKSSLSLWLGKVSLKNPQKYRLVQKQVEFRKLGAIAKRRQRIEKTEKIVKSAISEISQINNKELFLMGVMLYWAEGAKQRKSVSQGVEFSNSDPCMCKIFLAWLRLCLKVPEVDIAPTIYIHESKTKEASNALNYWSNIIGFSVDKFGKTCFTKTVYPRKNKRKDNGKYYGQLRIKVRKSTDLNRKIAGWIKGICLRSGVAGQNGL